MNIIVGRAENPSYIFIKILIIYRMGLVIILLLKTFKDKRRQKGLKNSILVISFITLLFMIIFSLSIIKIYAEFDKHTSVVVSGVIDSYTNAINKNGSKYFSDEDEYIDYLKNIFNDISLSSRYYITLHDENLNMLSDHPTTYVNIDNADIFNPSDHPEILNLMTNKYGMINLNKYGHDFLLNYQWIEYNNNKYVVFIYLNPNITTSIYKHKLMWFPILLVILMAFIETMQYYLIYINNTKKKLDRMEDSCE